MWPFLLGSETDLLTTICRRQNCMPQDRLRDNLDRGARSGYVRCHMSPEIVATNCTPTRFPAFLTKIRAAPYVIGKIRSPGPTPNVYELGNDWYQSDYYSVGPTKDPPGPSEGTYRVSSARAWIHPTHFLRVAKRSYYNPDFPDRWIEFRWALGGAFGDPTCWGAGF